MTLGWVASEKQSFLYQPTIAQAQNAILIPVSLPEIVTVYLKQWNTMSGVKLLEINTQAQQIKLQQSGNTESKSIASIKSLEFSGKTILKGGKPVIRGEEGLNCSNSENWTLPLNHFRWRDSNQAAVDISSFPKSRQKEITSIGGTLSQIEEKKNYKTYIIDQIKFGAPGSITVKTTPCFANQ